jgi:hypothetical protein
VNAPTWTSTIGDIDVQGDLTQTAAGNTVAGDLVQNMNAFVRGTPSMYLGSDEITDLIDGYVRAGNHDLIVSALQTDHAVVLTGPHGCGRETTAIAAIRQLRPGVRVRRFSLEDEDAEEIRARDEGYLVHAADAGLPRLEGCVEAVRASGGYLVVIGDAGGPPVSALLRSIVVEPPHPLKVYRHRMNRRGLTDQWHWDVAPTLLEGASPADARRLADITEEIAKRGGDRMAQRAEVINAYRNWEDQLRGWFTAHRRPDERALLVAAAALSPAEEANVYTVASSLARQLDIRMNGAGLVWCPASGLRELLEVGAEEERIVFRRYGFAEATLRHALADYPLASFDLLSWLAALPTEEAVQNELREPLAETFADLASEQGAAELIIETAGRWGADGLADLAFIALSRSCLHPRVGGKVRTALYKWSRAARTSQTLKLVIARVCEPLGQTYPSIALTRLKHLATHGNRQVAGEVILAAQALSTAGHRAEVLSAALAWCAENNEENLSNAARRRRRRAGASLFLELARPIAESGLPEVLEGGRNVDPMRYVPGWRAVLDCRDLIGGDDRWFGNDIHRWLDAALHHPRMRTRIVRIFIEAGRPTPVTGIAYGTVRPEPTAAKTLIDVVRQWAAVNRTDPARRDIKEAIVVPLTRPWWLRLLMALYIQLRTLIQMAGASR